MRIVHHPGKRVASGGRRFTEGQIIGNIAHAIEAAARRKFYLHVLTRTSIRSSTSSKGDRANGCGSPVRIRLYLRTVMPEMSEFFPQRDPLNTALFAYWQRQWNSLAPESFGAFSNAYPVSNTEHCKRNYHRKCHEKYAPIIPAKKQYHGQEQHDKP